MKEGKTEKYSRKLRNVSFFYMKAFITKDVIVSLFLGILSGALTVAGGNPITAKMNLSDLLADSLASGWNIQKFLFCSLLGGFFMNAFAAWVVALALFATGLVILPKL